MSERYRVLDFDEALAAGVVDEMERRYSEWDSFVVEFPDDALPVFVAKDGGEPEDQTLCRDWKWVVPTLNAAFESGKEAKSLECLWFYISKFRL